MHSAANSRKSVDGLRPSKVIPLSSFGIFFGIGIMRTRAELLRTDLPWLDGSRQSIAHSGQQARNPLAAPHREYFALKHLQPTEQPPSRLRPHRRSCCFARLVDVRHAANSTFKDIKVGQVPKSRRYSSEPHNFSAAWAKRRPWRFFIRVFVAHGRKRSLNRNVVRSRPAAALAHQCGNGELTNKQKKLVAHSRFW